MLILRPRFNAKFNAELNVKFKPPPLSFTESTPGLGRSRVARGLKFSANLVLIQWLTINVKFVLI